MEKSNPELISLYREYANNLKRGANASIETQEKIDELERRPVILSSITQNRENELREKIRKFEELLDQGMSKAEASRRLGYRDYPTMWKKYEELRRIETEQKTRQTFKDSLKVSKGELQAKSSDAEEKNVASTEIEIQSTETEK